MKHIIWSSIVAMMACLTACFDDESSLGNPNYNDITITLPGDMSVMSFTGEPLTIEPEVETGYDESTLTYAWYIYSGNESDADNGYRSQQISDAKTLNYEVNLSSGNYTLVFEVTSTTDGLVRTATMQLRTNTSFSQGFYILKETADGNTDLDVYGSESFSEDVLSGIYGAPLSGKPVNLAMTFDQSYIDEATQEMAGTNMVHVFTDAGIYRGFRSEDMTETFNEQTIRFDGMDADELPYAMMHGVYANFFFTSKGCYGNYSYGNGASSGIYGLTVDGSTGGSPYAVTLDGGNSGQCFWNNTTHRLDVVDIMFQSVYSLDYDAGDVDESHLECIACGENSFGMVATGYFLCEDQTNGKRYLYLVDLSMLTVTGPQELDPSLHIAQADIVSINGLTAYVIYCVHDNQIYAYDWTSGNESSVNLPGFPAGEEIIYFSNQYQKTSMFGSVLGGNSSTDYNNLIVGTRAENGYKLYFYNLPSGSVPIEAPAMTIEGTGTVKSVRFISPGFGAYLSNMGNYIMFGDPSSCVPYWD